MKKSIILCLITLTTCSLFAQLKPRQPLQPVDKFEGWFRDFDQAKEEAKNTNRAILGFFTFSDSDEKSDGIYHELLTTPMFKKFAADNLVLFVAIYPRGANVSAEALAKANELFHSYFRLNPEEHVPHIIVFNHEGGHVIKGGMVYRLGRGDGAYLTELTEFLEIFGYKVNSRALEKYKAEQKASAPATPGTPPKNTPPPPSTSTKNLNSAFEKLKQQQQEEAKRLGQ